MALIDSLFLSGSIRKAVWQWWYPFLTRRLRQDDILFLNYAFEEDPPLRIPLSASDEPNRNCIQLYHSIASLGTLSGKDVLEVSCGHGGGASYLVRYFKPRSYVGLDLNQTGIEFCRSRHVIPKLDFQQGDATRLPFETGTFDVVVNVEASHCYPDFRRFLDEVHRVLRPGGEFLYADFRFSDGFERWDSALESCPLQIASRKSIREQVLRGMSLNSRRSMDLVRRHLPSFLHSLGDDFAGVEGSRLFKSLTRGELDYRAFRLIKPDKPS